MAAASLVAFMPALVEADETNSIASWNIRNISNESRSDAELGIISLIIFRYDFIALQEVLDPEVIGRIRKILKDDFQAEYDFAVSGPVGRSKKERYAFMWRAGTVASIGSQRLYPDPGDRLEREPYCGTFRAGTFDWTTCTIHLLFGKNADDRRPELLVLDDVYRFERDRSSERDILICGDFNFDPTDTGWAELKAEDGMTFAIAPPVKTTIGDVSLYDNCWWPTAAREVVSGSGAVYAFDRDMFPAGSRKEANRLVSDHRPISIRARVDMPDDD